MDNDVDYYQILHVDREAPQAVIKASYRTLMQSMGEHPDLGGDHEVAAMINEAYAVLSNAKKREAYDRRMRTPSARGPISPSKAAAAQPRSLRSFGYESKQEISTDSRCPFCRRPHNLSITKDTTCTNCASPLALRRQEGLGASGNRAIERYPKEQPMQFYVDWPGSPMLGKTLDISPNGMLFETTVALQRKQVIKICCSLCDATASVAHVRQEAHAIAIGVEFLTLRFAQAQGGFVSVTA